MGKTRANIVFFVGWDIGYVGYGRGIVFECKDA
jgi:hypothetical protein